MLIAWLRELIYLSSTKRMVFWDFKITRFDVGAHLRVRPNKGGHMGPPLQIHAEIFGEKIDPKKHILKKEVKAVTYHGLSLKKTRAGWVAEVILDV
ncbi:MAG: archease [Candidatus Omnitrophica bacterium]|nr:archease [Candidatus Omnitrophota bacterium]